MFGKGKLELNRLHLVAVRLMDEVSRQLHELFPDRDWTPVGFRLKIERETGYKDLHAKLEIRPAHWPKGSLVTSYMVSKSGWYEFTGGEVIIPGLGKGAIGGHDLVRFGSQREPHGLISVVLVFSKE